MHGFFGDSDLKPIKDPIKFNGVYIPNYKAINVIPVLKSNPLDDSSNTKIIFSIPKTNKAIIGNAKLLPKVQSSQYSPLKYL